MSYGEIRRGTTALFFAKSPEMVNVLLSAGAIPNVFDDKGRTPLMTACSSGLEKVVSRMLEAGARVETRDKQGRAAIDFLVERSDLCDLLRPSEIAIRSVVRKITDEVASPLGSNAIEHEHGSGKRERGRGTEWGVTYEIAVLGEFIRSSIPMS